jgi:photosystem II stability/assembly factor-like uncharacterized protein
MTLFVGSVDGVWRIENGDSEGDRMLAAGAGSVIVWRVKTVDGDVYAATDAGLFRSSDGGVTWDNLEVPTQPVYSVAVAPDNRVYAGTHPPQVYVSTDGGWIERESLQDQPSRTEWDSPVHEEGQVRHLEVPPDTPKRVVAGVERGGVHVGDDRGTAWTERREGVWDDIHHLYSDDAGRYYASTGTGLYRTDDTGRSWERLDESLDRSYFRETIVHDGTLFTAATRGPSTTWRGSDGADGALFESDDRGETFDSVPYPGEGTEAVLAWASDGSDVFAGTDRGRVLVREDGNWEQWASVPAGIRSLVFAARASGGRSSSAGGTDATTGGHR